MESKIEYEELRSTINSIAELLDYTQYELYCMRMSATFNPSLTQVYIIGGYLGNIEAQRRKIEDILMRVFNETPENIELTNKVRNTIDNIAKSSAFEDVMVNTAIIKQITETMTPEEIADGFVLPSTNLPFQQAMVDSVRREFFLERAAQLREKQNENTNGEGA